MSFKLVGLPQRVAIHDTREFRGSVVCSDFLVLGLWEGACQCFLLCFFCCSVIGCVLSAKLHQVRLSIVIRGCRRINSCLCCRSSAVGGWALWDLRVSKLASRGARRPGGDSWNSRLGLRSSS